MRKLLDRIATSIATTIISNLELDSAVMICALKAEQEDRKILARTLKRCIRLHSNKKT